MQHCISLQGFESEVAIEAHGLLADLLLSKEALPSDTHQKLRRIKDILAPRIDRILSRPKVHIGVYVCACVCMCMYVCMYVSPSCRKVCFAVQIHP